MKSGPQEKPVEGRLVRPRHIHIWLLLRSAYSDEVIAAPVVTTLNKGTPWPGRRCPAAGLHRVQLRFVQHGNQIAP
jgi:hypothetical protein